MGRKIRLSPLLERRLFYLTICRRIYRILPGCLRVRFWLVMVLSIMRAAAESVSVFVIALMTQSVSSPASLRARWSYRTVVAALPQFIALRLEDDRFLIAAMCMAVVLFIIIKNLVSYLTVSRAALFSEQVGLFAGREAYARYLAKDYRWHLSRQSRKVVGRIEQRGHLAAVTGAIMQIFSNFICSAMLFAVLFTMSPGLTAMVAAVFALVCAAIYACLRRRLDAAGARVARLEARRGWMARMINRGIREIIIYRKQRAFLDDMVETARQAVPDKTFLAVSSHLPGWFLEMTGFCIIFSAMVYLVFRQVPMPQVIVAMSMLLLTAWRVLPLISRGMGLAVRVRSIRARALSFLELIEEGKGRQPAQGNVRADSFRIARTIELRDASFRYPDAPADSVRGISLIVRKGELIGLVGKSGSGKSTVGMLLAGLVRPASGAMLADGTELDDSALDAYRARVGYVPQDPLLFPGSIADNVALARWGEPPDREKILAACRFAAMDFIADGKKGLSYRLGDGGDGLSGGEAQRLAIARAMYAEPELLIFDEATSSLDRAAEAIIAESIHSLRGTVAGIVIAHRPSTLERCDRILWLEDGRIRESGTPADILPRYAAACGAGGSAKGRTRP